MGTWCDVAPWRRFFFATLGRFDEDGSANMEFHGGFQFVESLCHSISQIEMAGDLCQLRHVHKVFQGAECRSNGEILILEWTFHIHFLILGPEIPGTLVKPPMCAFSLK